LEAALRLKPAAGPPLSVEKIIMELLSIPRSASAVTTSPMHWSSLDNIPTWNRTSTVHNLLATFTHFNISFIKKNNAIKSYLSVKAVGPFSQRIALFIGPY
jgi:hypothetical protein